MHEDVRRAVLGGDEAEALDDVEPLARALLADPATCNSHGSSEGETQCQRVQGLSLTLAYIVIDHCSVQPATYEVEGVIRADQGSIPAAGIRGGTTTWVVRVSGRRQGFLGIVVRGQNNPEHAANYWQWRGILAGAPSMSRTNDKRLVSNHSTQHDLRRRYHNVLHVSNGI